MKRERIVKIPKIGKIVRTSITYIGKYITKKPLLFNLNLNVTNLCNQNCPMCNAVIVGKEKGTTITFKDCKEYLNILSPYKIASLTISGGEPSLVKEIPEILEYTENRFPFGVNINSNLYAKKSIISRFAESALKTNTRIGTSFDGFGDTADSLRGAKDVSNRVLKNIELVTELRRELKSESTLNIHTVISDQNIDEIPDILAISDKFGWTHTLAPVNNFFYQDSSEEYAPKLHYSEKLEKVIELAGKKKNIAVSKDFLLSIPKFTKCETDKLCPYLSGIFKTSKVFLDPNGDLSLCSREPIGNIRDSSVVEMLKGKKYQDEIVNYTHCPGCWLACFVEMPLATPKFYQKRLVNSYTL